jgi:hypothetical protein
MAEPTRTEVENPAEALRNEDGIFRVISPYGQVFRVTCKKGHNMRIREIGSLESSPREVAHHERFDGTGDDPSTGRWQVEKIA